MSKILTGRTLRERISDAIRAFRGKPARGIQLGVRVVRCDECKPLCSLCGAKIEKMPSVYDQLKAYTDEEEAET